MNKVLDLLLLPEEKSDKFIVMAKSTICNEKTTKKINEDTTVLNIDTD